MSLPASVVRGNISREELLQLARDHKVHIGRERDLPLLRDKLCDHRCSETCPVDLWLFKRPMFSVFNKFRSAHDMDSARSPDFSTSVPLPPLTFLDPVVLHHNFVADPPMDVPSAEATSIPAVPPRFPPRPVEVGDVASIIRDWVEDCSADALAEGACAVCAQLTNCKQLRTVPLDGPWLAIVNGGTEQALPASPEHRNDPYGLLCLEGVNFVTQCASLCTSCYNSLIKRHCLPRMSLANGLWLGPQPEELKDLTFIEKQMIARYRHNHSIITVRGCGARKMHCNAIVFSQPVAEFRQVLPPTLDELSDLIAVLFIGPVAPTERDLARVPFLIRRSKVLRALEWLKEHHPQYRDLTISRTNLDAYPENTPPVAWYYDKGDGKPEANSLAVNDNLADRGLADDSSFFAVHGVCADRVADMDFSTRKAITAQHLKDGGRVLGYGHAVEPESVFRNRHMLPGLFPWLFPYGLGGLANENGSVHVPRRTHIRWFMNYCDRRFQTDDYFPFLIFNQEQIRASSKGGFALIEKSHYPDVVEKLLNLNGDALAEMISRGKDNGYIKPQTDAEKRCYEVLSMIDHVAHNVACSSTKKKNQRNQIRSLIYAYSVPMFFITFAPSESKSKICLHFCGQPVDLDDYLPMSLSEIERLHAVVSNPAACAKFFDLMVRLFIKHVLRADTGRDGAFGRTSAYFGTVEQQGRTTLHLHLLLWIAGSCSPQQIRDRALDESSTFAAEIISWLESCHQGEFSTGKEADIAEKVRAKRSCSASSSAAANSQWPDPRTALPSPPPVGADEERLNLWFQQVCAITDEIVYICNLHTHGSWCRRRKGVCHARFPRGPLHESSFVELETGALRLKKGEAWINTFSIVLSYLMRCNTDVTCLLSGTQVRAVIAYVTDYITKPGLKTYNVFEAVQSVLNGSARIMSQSSSRSDAARRMITKMVNALISQQEVGGPMVCSDLLGLPDHYTNKKFKPLFWKSYVNRVGNAWNETCSEGSDADKEMVVLMKRSGRVVGYSKIDDYAMRPEELQYMSLYEFMQRTEVIKISPAMRLKMNARQCVLDESDKQRLCEDDDMREDEVIDDEDGLRSFIVNDEEDDLDELADDLPDNIPQDGRFVEQGVCFDFLPAHVKHGTHGVVVLPPERSRVVDFIGPALPRVDRGDHEEYCRTMLTIFAPWRSGLELKGPTELWEYVHRRTPCKDEHVAVKCNMNLLYECLDARDDYSTRRKTEAVEDDLPSFLPSEELDDLEAHDDDRSYQDAISADMQDQLTDDIDFLVSAGTTRRRAEMSNMTELFESLMGERPSTPVSSSLAHAGKVDIPRKLPSAWKDIVQAARQDVIQSRQRGIPEQRPAPEAELYERVADAHDMTGVRVLDERGVDELLSSTRRRTDHDGNSLPSSMTPHGRQQLIRTVIDQFQLNAEQRRAFRIAVTNFEGDGNPPLRMYLGGMAGTGKSRVVHALSEYLERCNMRHRFVLLAPTGTAACLINGSTYHSALNISVNGHTSVAQLSKLREALLHVDIIFIDEISMVGCKDMYEISAHLANAFNLPLTAFAGKHIIVAGDFCQLPPPGIKQASLYSSSVGLDAQGRYLDGQKKSYGRSLWHTFTTVVILRQNMRQAGMSEDDNRFRIALENMRYGACTPDDITLLRRRVAGVAEDCETLKDPKFRWEPIVVERNTHRDAINTAASHRFAQEHGLQLEEFHSVDEFKQFVFPRSVAQSIRDAKKSLAVQLRKGMPQSLKQTLWELPPCDTDHVAGTLSLCVGLPVIMKHNDGTELGAVNGAEGFVVSWDSAPLLNGRRRLLTVFIQLKNPPAPLQLPGLPPNVVPVPYTSEHIKCVLPDETEISIKRDQVFILPNFAMTDFAVQGRTRPFNPVDLSFCKGHQSMYTCLSRSSSLAGTLILQDFDQRKITSGMSRDLRRELRELEILDDITRLKFIGKLPQLIHGTDRRELISSYQAYFGLRYVPNGVHRGLDWRNASLFELMPPGRCEPWSIASAKRAQDEEEGECERPSKRVRITTSRGVVVDARVYKGVVSVVQSNVRPLPRIPPASIPHGSRILPGTVWDDRNWSCAYDSLITILWNTHRELNTAWSTVVADNTNCRMLDVAFRASDGEHDPHNALHRARELMRDLASAHDPVSCPRSGRRSTCIEPLVNLFFTGSVPFGQSFWSCERCGAIRDVQDLRSYLWSTAFNSRTAVRTTSITSTRIFSELLAEHGARPCPQCLHGTSLHSHNHFIATPPFLLLEIPAEDQRFPRLIVDDLVSLTLDGNEKTWRLFGAIYLGSNHFTARFALSDGSRWYHDGISTRNQCAPESTADMGSAHGKKVCIVMYALIS